MVYERKGEESFPSLKIGDLKTLAKAIMELEEYYSGVPDDSVNLTFQDLTIHVSVSSFLPLCIKHFYILPRDGQDEKMEILGGRDKDTGLSIFNRYDRLMVTILFGHKILGLWKSPLPKLRNNRNGRDDRRYISRAGMVGCCSGYPGTVKQAELKWAEKGSRGESIYTIMTSRSGGPMTPPIGTK
ncbi:hypothetical protein SADUNF_Sadunf19G0117700 [Salix dunnii]|uniref:Uncharacterized protein n=1 Tax=Salix dunnii TaxID=1413687 RepID=A0A835IZP3_9ROSI|nr:hypothetical protein SADUNF_Sadunf19G0117700 [Salix dunnii]